MPFTAPVVLGQDASEKSDAALFQEIKEGMDDLPSIRPAIQEILRRLVETTPAQREPYLFLAGLSYLDEYEKTQNEGLLREAAEQYELYLKEFPNGVRRDFVRYNLGLIYSDLDNFDGAIEHFGWLYRRSENSTLRSEARDRMSQLYIRSDRAAEGIPLFLEVFQTSLLDPEVRAQASSWLLQGYLASGETTKIFPYLRYLTGRYEAIYDPKFNITLLKAGDALFEKENFDQAILLYTFVKPRDAIIEFYRDLIANLRGKIRFLNPESEEYTVMEGRLNAAQANLEAVGEIREYDVDMKWRIARVYKETGRTWEALWAFFHLYEDYPDHKKVEDFLYISFEEAKKVEDAEMMLKLALDYLGNDQFVKYRDPIILGLAKFYSDNAMYAELLDLATDYLESPKNFSVAAQLLNYVGNSFIVQGDFAGLQAYAKPLYERFEGDEPLYEAARYWYGLSLILLADYSLASGILSEFIIDYDFDSAFYEDVYYRYGICLYGEQEYTAAENQFVKFVNRYPDSALRGEAELYLGDLKRDRGDYEGAISHYASVGNYTDNDAFIAKAVFARTEVLVTIREGDEALAVLQDYAERYGKRGQLAEAYRRAGQILDSQGRLDERFALHANAIRELGNDLKRYAVDELIEDYARDYTGYVKTFEQTVEFIDKLAADAEFRKTFLTDRAFQYQFMQSAEGRVLDTTFANLVVRDRDFRARIIETEPEINPATGEPKPLPDDAVTEDMVLTEFDKLRQTFVDKLEALAPYDAKALFMSVRQQARKADQKVLEMRAEVALDYLTKASREVSYSMDELAMAPPAVMIWAGGKFEETRPQDAKVLYSLVIQRHPFSPTVYDALVALGDMTMRQATETGDRPLYEEALNYYSVLTDRYAMRSKNAKPFLEKGRILLELGRDDEAINVFGRIVRNPQWKGIDHAKAHLELGLAYRNKNELAEAHGFFERLIVAYGGFAEIVSWAYYYDLLTLRDMGETESVQQLLEEYRTREAVLSKTEAFKLIDENFNL